MKKQQRRPSGEMATSLEFGALRSWAEDQLWPIDRVKPYERNPRHNEQAVDAVANSITEFGFRQPIVVDRAGVIIVGHTRLKAAIKLGLTHVPVHVAGDLTDDQAKAYRIADNKTADLATWNDELLPLELGDLQSAGFDLSVLGFEPSALAELLAPAGTIGLTDPDDIPEPPDEAVTQRGDIWVMGNHRLICGDSGNAADVDRLLAGGVIHLVNTDPPYNVKVEPRSNNAIAAGLSSFQATHHQQMDAARRPGCTKGTHAKMRAKDRPLANDFVSESEFERLLQGWFGTISRVLQPGRCFYIWGGYANCANYPPVLKALELYFSQAIIWVKGHPVMTRKDFMGNHEWCFYGWRLGAGHQYFGPNNATDVWEIKKVSPQKMVHLTEKPVELAARAIEYSSRKGENVLDIFGGSGSTLIACEQTGRNARLVELDPPYCDVIVKRWEQFTGRKAERRSFDDGDELPRLRGSNRRGRRSNLLAVQRGSARGAPPLRQSCSGAGGVALEQPNRSAQASDKDRPHATKVREKTPARKPGRRQAA